MNKQHIENIIRHEFKKTPYKVVGIEWDSYFAYPDEVLTEAIVKLNVEPSWKKLYRRFSRLEGKLNKKYGINLEAVEA